MALPAKLFLAIVFVAGSAADLCASGSLPISSGQNLAASKGSTAWCLGTLPILITLVSLSAVVGYFARREKPTGSRWIQEENETASVHSEPARAEVAKEIIEGREFLLTPSERAFFSVLEPIVRRSCVISAKVSLADLFHVRHSAGHRTAFHTISQKPIDFVLTEPGTSRILCAIELEDEALPTGDGTDRDAFVDELFAAQQLPLLRIPSAWTYFPQALRAELLKSGLVLSQVA